MASASLMLSCLIIAQPAAPLDSRPLGSPPRDAPDKDVSPNKPAQSASSPLSVKESSLPRERAADGSSSVPLTGKLAPVRHYGPDQLVHTVLAEMMKTPPEAKQSGRPISLFEALARAAGRWTRAKTVKSYWAVCAAASRENIRLDALHRIKRLADGMRREPVGPSSPELDAALASAKAQLRESSLAALETRSRLSNSMGDPQLEPLCSSVPHVGGYRTEFQRLFARRPAPANLLLIHRLLPLRRRCIQLRADAVQATQKSLATAEAAHRQGRLKLHDVLYQIDAYRAARDAFIAEVEQYNANIADYASATAREGGDLNSFVAMLIHRQTAQPTPAAPPPGAAAQPPSMFVSPPKPKNLGNSKTSDKSGAKKPANGEHSILRSTVRLRDGSVRPANLERPASDGNPPKSPRKKLKRVDEQNPPKLLPLPSPASAKPKGANPKGSETSKVKTNAKEPGGEKQTEFRYNVRREVNKPRLVERLEAGAVKPKLISPEQQAEQFARTLHANGNNPLAFAITPKTLAQCLRYVTSPGDRSRLIANYWSAREQAGRLRTFVVRQKRVESLELNGAETERSAEESNASWFWQATSKIAEADVLHARIDLIAACFHLTVAARRPRSSGWLWPVTQPPARRFAAMPVTAPSPGQSHLARVLRGSHELLLDQTLAAATADKARVAAMALPRDDIPSMAAAVAAIERQHEETLRFLGALTRYNLVHADHTLLALPQNVQPETLAESLLHTRHP